MCACMTVCVCFHCRLLLHLHAHVFGYVFGCISKGPLWSPHTEPHVRRNPDHTITVCKDFMRGDCHRDQCRYCHPPPHIVMQMVMGVGAALVPPVSIPLQYLCFFNFILFPSCSTPTSPLASYLCPSFNAFLLVRVVGKPCTS